jgi:hypothetical protein
MARMMLDEHRIPMLLWTPFELCFGCK